MRVHFKSFGPIRRVVGEPVIKLSVEEQSTIRDVIDAVIVLYGTQLAKIILENDGISGNLIILLNRRDTNRLDGLNTLVSEGDEIALLPHVQGG